MIVEIPGVDGMRQVVDAPLVDVYLAGDGAVRLIDNHSYTHITLTADDLRYLQSELIRNELVT